jgi:hypothetical protein
VSGFVPGIEVLDTTPKEFEAMDAVGLRLQAAPIKKGYRVELKPPRARGTLDSAQRAT